MAARETLVVLKRRELERPWTIETYLGSDGYDGLRKAVTEMTPEEVIKTVQDSGLRGRGGAGMGTGLKWSLIPKDSPKPRYVVCNGDEGEPGAFHDRELMEIDPHALLEGMLIAAYAIGAKHCFIYLRGEMLLARERLEAAIKDAYQRGFIGEHIFDTDFSCEMVLHLGAGAYICGEETALLESLGGYRGMPRPRPPFPVTEGLYACPTVVNNVQSLQAAAQVVLNGADWYKQWGTERSPGTLVCSVSGAVNNPRNVEVPLGTTVADVLSLAGGVDDRGMKAFAPGGWSTPMLPGDRTDATMDYEGMVAAGSVLGASSIIVVPNDMCIVRAVWRGSKFYSHESCGKCTPCREGTYWVEKILERIEHGQGVPGDIERLDSVNTQMSGFKSLCALAEFAAGPVGSSIVHFREEYEEHIKLGACPMTQEKATA
ncbi:MAG: NADH-quinone oxidoreductase subunit NuoF [Actinomycetota bacterium]